MTSPLYSVEREFAVSVETLWLAWTQAQQLEKWYSPVDLSVVPGSVISEAWVDGLWTVAVDVPMHDMVAYFFGRYTAVEENVRLEHTLHYTQSVEEFGVRDESTPHHLIVLDFERRGDNSWVRFSQFGQMPQEQIELTRQGTTSYFDNLEKYLIF